MNEEERENAFALRHELLDGLYDLDEDQLHYLDNLGEVEDPLSDDIDCDTDEHPETSREELWAEDFDLWEDELGPLAAPLRDPFSLWKPWRGKSTTALRHDIICLHTMVGTLTGSWSWASGSGRPYWHYGINAQGTIWQCQDLRYRSAANLNGNWRVIPIETSDIGEGVFASTWQDPMWTKAQMDAIIKLVAWLCITFNIPPVLIPDTCSGRRGIAYHRQGIDPHRRSGCEMWSRARGKICPARRIGQIESVIIPGVRKLVLGGEPPKKQEEDEDMFIADCKGKPALVVAGPNQVMKINNEQRSALRASGVRAKLVDTKHHNALLTLDDRGDQLRKVVDDVLKWHAAVGTFGSPKKVEGEPPKAKEEEEESS